MSKKQKKRKKISTSIRYKVRENIELSTSNKHDSLRAVKWTWYVLYVYTYIYIIHRYIYTYCIVHIIII